MFYITGDVHADIKDFQNRSFGRVKKDDHVVVCGDFGILWDGSKTEKKNIRNIGKSKHHTLFIDGSHENFDLLKAYPVTEWCGGNVQVLSGNLLHLMRGQVYTIGDRKIFVFGGGESTDREMRTEHLSWWSEEIPAEAEMSEGLKNLENAGWNVDYIFTHEAPSSIKLMMGDGESDLNVLNDYLETVREKTKFTKWVFANYHRNKRISSNLEVVFDGVMKLE